ncbi:MAG: PaREP1 family protein [Nitrososphaerota archaeon]
MSHAGFDEEVYRTVSEYLERSKRHQENLREFIQRGELEKAGDMLWGILSCYSNALSILLRGQKGVLRTHRDTIRFLEEFAKSIGDKRVIDAVKEAERLHANFYHGFIRDAEDLRKHYEGVYLLIQLLDEQIRKLFAPSPSR